jgi:phosphatidylinositol transfer protein SFH5
VINGAFNRRCFILFQKSVLISLPFTHLQSYLNHRENQNFLIILQDHKSTMAETQTPKETPAKAGDDAAAVDALVNATATTSINDTKPTTEAPSEVTPAKAETTTEAKTDASATERAAAAGAVSLPETKEEAKSDEPAAAAQTSAPVEKKLAFKDDEQDAMSSASSLQHLWALAKAHAHPEVWGVTLADPDVHVPSQVIFQKYLNANDGDLTKAKDQLTKTLDWRAKMKPLELLKEQFSREKKV